MPRNSPDWTSTQVTAELKKFNYWYHKIELSADVTTPGMNLKPIWANIERAMRSIDYLDKTMLALDIGDRLVDCRDKQVIL